MTKAEVEAKFALIRAAKELLEAGDADSSELAKVHITAAQRHIAFAETRMETP
jgi:hypothetical protein